MPTSAHGSELKAVPHARRHARRPSARAFGAGAPPGVARARTARGFTLIELLVVLVLVAIGAGIVSLALRDPAATKLEEEGARLTALLEAARAESRAAGVPVQWVPAGGEERAAAAAAADSADEAPGFRFVGLPASVAMPTRWLEPRVSAQVVGAKALVLGPDAIVPPQRLVLSLDDRRLEIATDGLAPFAVSPGPDEPR
ncbi:MAG: prepilin-type N-terminal cleavage/methylation domain-containing protein [Rubrivivax sp.]|nr:prepilin-type N-terminal cleavage/methylation domain-containing protein [Rubrivivax sp.]